MKPKKPIQNAQVLEARIQGASWLRRHTGDQEAIDKYTLIIETAKQDYYVATGYDFRETGCVG